ncbi:hypothetical protein L596_016594 [Steinernema carpocapsae]|uniref:Uncharacterized protein n=1 Tax=Steinernema carpocapsae TaxID=34508 RepID=A0A4V6A3F5_STECR|nr:hypothetical protein L596_016594 [Steinernema carpocapsae]
MAGTKPQVTIDPLAIWERSAESFQNEENDPNQKAKARSSVAERFAGTRSQVWENLSAMSAHDQAAFMSKLVVNWPYDMERRALNFPLHGSICFTASLAASKINGEFFLMNNRIGYFDSIKQCPRSPFIFGCYTAGISYYVLHQSYIMKKLYAEERPCTSCILTQNVFNGLLAGVAIPMLTLPYLAYYVLLQRKGDKYPKLTTYIDFLTLSWEGCKSILPYVVALVALHVAIGAVGAYSMVWGRNRIFDTLDVDQDASTRALRAAAEATSFKKKVELFLKKFPFYGRLVGGGDVADDI